MILVRPILCLLAVMFASFATAKPNDVRKEQETLIPKRETGVLEFLKKHPEYDGRGVVIAVFDTGVDPAAAGLQTTSTGERKIIDIIDASGSGDVDTSQVVERGKDGTLQGLTGRVLKLPKKKVANPSGKFHLGIKRGYDLFHRGVRDRVKQLRAEAWQREHREIVNQRMRERAAAEQKGERGAFDKAPDDLTLKEKDAVARESLLEQLEQGYAGSDPGPVYDCVVWSDGEHFHVIVDTDEDGDLGDEKALRPFGVSGEFASFGDEEASHFSVQVYDEGKLLSIVTVSGSHGSHVAAIAAAHFPEEPHRNGVAPGAKILSVKIGDTRLGGSSSGAGEMRGVAACSQYGVDIMNASWGGASQYQDGTSTSAQLYNLLVEKYGVTAFVSAGNSGPALSTLGSPGGEAVSVIGVGAYVSPEMGRVLHSQTEEVPSTAYNFTARGPAKNGDLGVDVMGPGGAVASLAYDSLRRSENYVGTSMSSPSVAGLGALLVSAAKQNKLPHSPPRIRAAMMNGARFVDEVEVFAQGAGLVQALPAWEHLKSNAAQPAWGHFYKVVNEDNTFASGPGLYLRGDIPVGKRRLRFDITPRYLESVENAEKFALEEDVKFTATAPWIKIPDYARLANGRLTVRPIIDIPESHPRAEQVFYGEIHAALASAPDAGPLVRIPLTIVRGQETDPHGEHRASYNIFTASGKTDRQFFQVPEHANFLKLRVRYDADDALKRVFKIHVVTLSANESYYGHNLRTYQNLAVDEESEFLVPVAAGKTTEIAIQQPWFTAGDAKIDVDLQFVGIRADQDLVHFRENDEFAPLEIASLSNLEVQPEGAIDRAHFVAMPEKTEFLAPDGRHTMAPGPRQDEEFTPPVLRQTFSISVEKPTKIQLEPGRRYDTGHGLAYAMVTFYHESGKFLYQGGVWDRPSVDLPKGKTTVYRVLRSLSKPLLEQEKDRPMGYSYKLEKPKMLALSLTSREAIRGLKASNLKLRGGRQNSVMVGADNLASLSSMKPAPDYFSGSLKLKQGKDRQLFEIGVECRPGADFNSVANQKKKPEPHEKKVGAIEKLENDLYDRRLAFVRATRFSSKAEEKAKRDELLEGLAEEKPKNADLHVLRAMILAGEAGLLSAWHQPPAPEKKQGKKKSKPSKDSKKVVRKKIFANLKKARELTVPQEVAAYFGARGDDSDAPLDEKKANSEKRKKMEERRKRLATIERLRADVQLNLGQLAQSRKSLAQSRRWEDQPSKDHQKHELALLIKEELYGLALRKLQVQLKEDPFDKKLLEQQIELYEELGWDDRWAERSRLRSKMRDSRLALPQ